MRYLLLMCADDSVELTPAEDTAEAGRRHPGGW
jgi:hypothetical protein